jgi:hypothetical protein
LILKWIQDRVQGEDVFRRAITEADNPETVVGGIVEAIF